MTVRALVLGPTPGSSGGIGIMMSHVESSSSIVSDFHFANSGASGAHRMQSFLKCMAHLLGGVDFDIAHINLASNGSTLRKILLSFPLRLRRVPYVIHLHGGGYKTFYSRLPAAAKWVVRRFFQRAASVIVLGRVWENFVVSELRVDRSAVRILPNAVPGPDWIDPQRRENRVLFAGKLVPSKGIWELLRAAELVSTDISWCLDLAGDCSDPEILAAMRASKANIKWHGWVDQERLAALMSQAAVFALPSHIEGLPLSLLDAMAHGVMPLVTPVGSIPEVIMNGRNGVLIDVGNADDLAAAIEISFRQDAAADNIRQNARNAWESNYSIGSYRKSLDEIYCRALERRYAA